MRNPFSLMFGKRPMQEVERPAARNEIIEEFSVAPIGQQIYIVTGIRGSGKTVLMTEVAQYFQTEEDWIVVELNPEKKLIHSLISKLGSNEKSMALLSSAKLNLSVFGVSIEVGPVITDEETALERILEHLNKHGKRVLVTIDEATNNQNMKVWAGTFQMMVRKELPLFLLMTGLYENIENLQNEDSLTFLYRAPKIKLQPLNITAVTERYMHIFSIERESAQAMAVLTKGYAFAFQTLGYLTWNNQGDYEDAIPSYQQYLAEFSYDKIWSELSEKDKKVAYAIATIPSGKIMDIRAQLSMETNEFNPYRSRLIKKGIVNGNKHGYVSFELPLFDEYVKDKYGNY